MSKLEYATTQPACVAELQAGTFAKSPPTDLPTGTVTFPPMSSAETRRRRVSGLASIWYLMRAVSINAPCEWPMSTTPRPWL